MSNNSSPLIQTLNPERLLGWSMDFVDAGYTALLVKNGRCIRIWNPGRHFSFAIPLLEKSEVVLVDTKIRNLQIVSQGDFLSRDQYLVNVSLSVMYQVIDPRRVALEISEPVEALTSAVKDNLGVVIGRLSVEQLINQGRVLVRQYLLENLDVAYSLGFTLEDVRVSDISFPQTRGVIRQVEGMSARQEAEHEATLQMKIAQAGKPEIPPPPVQQVNIISGQDANSDANWQDTDIALEAQLAASASLPAQKKPLELPRTVLAPGGVIARLVNRSSAANVVISPLPFSIGREPTNSLVLDDPLCSRNHARIVQNNDLQGNLRYQLIDIGSSNGTFVDGQRLEINQPFWLIKGNVIRIGSVEWTFEV